MSEPDNPTVVAPGAALAAARQAQNLSVADAARQLRLSVSQVEALEAGAFEKLPGTIFVHGFTRNYARLLKLDADALLRSVDLTLPSAPVTEEMPPSQEIPFPTAQPKRGPWYAFALVLLLGGLAAFEFFWNEPVSTVSKTATLPRCSGHTVLRFDLAAQQAGSRHTLKVEMSLSELSGNWPETDLTNDHRTFPEITLPPIYQAILPVINR